MNSITFNGVSSASLGILVESVPKRVWPDRKYEATAVNGRNGDLIVDYGNYANTKRAYNIAMASTGGKRVYELIDTLSKWIHSGSGYCRLEDTFEPDRVRIAAYSGAAEPDFYTEQSRNTLTETGVIVRTSIEFNCKPQIYEKQWYDDPFISSALYTASNAANFSNYISGLANTDNLKNTPWACSPKLIFTAAANGSITIRNTASPFDYYVVSWGSWSSSSLNERVVVDSELRDIYGESSGTNLNANFLCVHRTPLDPSQPNGDSTFEYAFPMIPPGAFTVSISNVSNYAFYKRSFMI